MKIESQKDISFKSIYTSRIIKKGLELSTSNGALFGASAAVAFSVIRPISIMCAPKTDKDNKKIAAAKSITSSLINFLLMILLSVPLAKSIELIDKNPHKYLKQSTIESLKDRGKDLTDSKGYVFVTQLFKLGIAALVAIPKSILTASGIPLIMDKMSDKKKDSTDNLSFRGLKDKTATKIGNLFNKRGMQNFVEKYKNSNFPMHITAATDAIATLSFIQHAKQNKKIEENPKKALIYNSLISTALSITGGYTIDKLLAKPTEKFIEKYKKINIKDKNLEKQIQGIKIAKPFLILGTIYYVFIPLIATFLADRAANNKN